MRQDKLEKQINKLLILIETEGRKCLRLYGVGHMVKDHSDSQRGNPLPPLHGLLFSISSKGSFICTIPQTGYSLCYPIRGALAGTRNT